MSDQLDMTGSDKRGRELVEKIIKTVGDSQKFIVQPLPYELLVTEDQFKSMLSTDEMQNYKVFADTQASKEKLFYTPHNVMEVKVV